MSMVRWCFAGLTLSGGCSRIYLRISLEKPLPSSTASNVPSSSVRRHGNTALLQAFLVLIYNYHTVTHQQCPLITKTDEILYSIRGRLECPNRATERTDAGANRVHATDLSPLVPGPRRSHSCQAPTLTSGRTYKTSKCSSQEQTSRATGHLHQQCSPLVNLQKEVHFKTRS